jgi:hypothetical protein
MRGSNRVLAVFLLVMAVASPASAKCGLFQVQCRDDEYCRSLGTQPGTDSYVQCRLFKEQQHQQAWSNAANNYLRMQQLQQLNRPRIYNCTTTYLGNQAHTTCY